MKPSRSLRIGPASLRPAIPAVVASLALLTLFLLVSAAIPAASAQDQDQQSSQPKEQTWGDSWVPQVYSAENTGAHFPAPQFPTFAKLPIIRPLPDPFIFADGSRSSDFSSWERHRNEIFSAVEQDLLGPKPDCHDCTITASYAQNAANPLQGTLTVNVTRNGHSMTETAVITLPSSGSGPFPYVIGIVNGTGSLPASLFAGVATIAYNQNQVTTYGNPQATDGFYTLYPSLCAGSTCTVATNYGEGGSNSGQYAAWAWGISRLIDGIEIASHQAVNPLPLDTTHSAVTGCSYAGKEALYAGALDERIALTIAQENGGGGAPSWRVNHEIESPAPPGAKVGAAGSVEDIDDTNYQWFSGQMFQFAGNNVYKLPIDQHELMAMIAPRALLETGNTDFYWLGNGANYVSARATQQIYNQFGIGDRFGFIIDGNHNHCAVPAVQMPEVAAFIDKFLLGQNVSTDIEVYPNPYVQEETQPPYSLPMGDFSGHYLAKDGTPFPTDYPYLFTTMDYSRWTHWWGTHFPVFPNDWNTGGTAVLSQTSRQPMKLNSGDTLQAGYRLGMPGTHAAATVTVANANVQTDVLCPDGTSYTLAVPLPVDQTYAFAASGKPFSFNYQPTPAVDQGSATNPGCGTGGAGRTTGTYLTVVGVQDGFAGDGAGPGFITTDTTDPLLVTFHTKDATTGWVSPWKVPALVNFNPLNYPSPPLPQQF